MLDENQYEEFRFVGMGEKAAVKQFKAESSLAESLDDKKKSLDYWTKKAAEELSHADKSEESVYNLAYAQQMQRLWENEVKKA